MHKYKFLLTNEKGWQEVDYKSIYLNFAFDFLQLFGESDCSVALMVTCLSIRLSLCIVPISSV